MKSKILLFLIIAIFLGAFAYLKFASPKEVQQLSFSTTLPKKSNEISGNDFATYTNTEHGYEISYPKKSFTRLICSNEQLDLAEKSENKDVIDMPTCSRGGLYTIEVKARFISPNEHVDYKLKDFEDMGLNKDAFSIAKSSFTVAGMSADKFIIKMTGDPKGPAPFSDWNEFVNLYTNGRIYSFSLENELYQQEFEHMLTTFKLLN